MSKYNCNQDSLVDGMVDCLTARPWKVDYTIDEHGNMTNIEFWRNGYTSYIDIIKRVSKDNGNTREFKVVCYGDYESFVLGQNWWNFYLDDIDPYNLGYNLEKVEAGKARVFDYEAFVQDAKEYFEENEYDEKTLGEEAWSDIQYEIDEVESEYDRVPHLEKIEEIFKDYLGYEPSEFMMAACRWGYVYADHFICQMAIIKIAQDAYRKERYEVEHSND